LAYLSLRLATPGKILPSSSSKEAPPPVEAWLTLSTTLNFFAAVAVSPPPTTEVAPAAVAAAIDAQRVRCSRAVIFPRFRHGDEEQRQRARKHTQGHRPDSVQVGSEGDDGRHQHASELGYALGHVPIWNKSRRELKQQLD
jgi:hypothetical protein